MDQNRIQEGLMALFQQMRGRERNEEAGEDREVGDEVMEDFLQMLLRQRPPARPPPASPIDEQAYACAKAGDLEGFKRCLASGANIKYQHDCEKPNMSAGGAPKIKTPLHVACCKGHANLVSYILDTQPDTVDDISPDIQRNALHYACNRKGNVEVIELLLKKGRMDVNAKSRAAWTPFHYAVAASRMDICQYLEKNGALPHTEFEQGGNAITVAACSKNEALVKWLMDVGVSPNVQDHLGLTPLHRLARYGDLNMTKVLVEYGHADVTLNDNSGCSAMEEADRNNMSEIATYLWTKGCESTSVKNPDGLGPTAWFRVRNIRLPSSRYGCGFTHMGSKLVLFSGLGQQIDFVNHDNENHMPQEILTSPLKDTYIADLNTVVHASILPSGVNPARPELSLSSTKCGRFIRLDADGLGGWSIPQAQLVDPDATTTEDRFGASIVTSTHPFKREDKFGYFELHVINAGEARILTIGLVDAEYPVNQKQPGWAPDSYGYHGDDGGCFHNNGAGKAWAERFNPGDVIGCGINFEGDGMNKGEVFWTKNGKFLGISHIGPQKDAYYAAIGVENDGAIFKVNFGKTPFQFSFVVPTLTWTRCPAQEEFFCTHGRLVPLPDVDEVLAIPDRMTALTQKVWLFNMRTTKWRTQTAIGVRPFVLNGSQHVRLGNDVYIWNTKKSNDDEPMSYPRRSPALYRLSLEYWTWSELLSYNVLTDETLDDNLNPVEEDEDDSDDEEDVKQNKSQKKTEAAVPKSTEAQKLPLKTSSKDPAAASTTALFSLSSSIDGKPSSLGARPSSLSGQEDKEDDEENSKMTPKELLSVRMARAVSLLDSDFNDAFVVAMEEDLVFVSHMKMLKVNPKTFVHSVHDLRGTRPKITHHSSIAVGSDIVTFGGWDDRKQQNELFILDTKSCLWYKPHISGLLFPRARNNHSCLYYETADPKFAIDPSDDTESQSLALHTPSEPTYGTDLLASTELSSSTGLSSSMNLSSSMAMDSPEEGKSTNGLVYRFCVFAMGWNGSNTMTDIDFVALDTTKRAEELGNTLETSRFPGQLTSATTAAVDFDIQLEVENAGQEKAIIGAHKAILYARSDYFKTLLTEDLLQSAGLASSAPQSTALTTVQITNASVEHVKALIKFLYTDHVNVVQLLSEYRSFVKLAETYAPNHVQRLVAEYLHTKVYEPERLNEELGELLSSGAFADVTFRVQGQEFKAHKVVLVARSQFFRAMLIGGLAESRQTVIEFDDAAPAEFGALLRFLYSRHVDYAHISEYILPLFTLASRTDARRLKTILESLIAFNLDATNVASLLLLADQHAADTLRTSCVDYIKRDPDAVQYDEPDLKSSVHLVLSRSN